MANGKVTKRVAPYTTGLHDGNAYWMARLSKEVYLKKSPGNQIPDEEQILKNLKQDDGRFLSVFGVDKNSAQAALIEHEEFLCMAFRGTNELKDWLDNINAFATQQLFGEFHRGFWNSVEDVWKPLNDKFRDLQQQRRRPLFLTGHSLGGAMATVAAARMVHEDKPFTSVYTFGQPRVLTRSTARTFNNECKSRYFRFHNNNDIVTRAPARLMGYSHIGSYLYISAEKEIHPEVGFWFKFVDYFDGALSALLEDGIDAVEDHNMDRYLAAVNAWHLKD
ncbi:lipase family protein [Motiliproteus coralliicola]|uniref:Lipase family protein n=1 Tax=Motiliproteus coralliicola TaxID=2283196 RepID=A0A369WD62_9GAMM|nr:lipase family protein [Motiliproteus coralliicola]RDE19577.1 lipase family protein [Motiliproteus coralliicola]